MALDGNQKKGDDYPCCCRKISQIATKKQAVFCVLHNKQEVARRTARAAGGMDTASTA